MNPAIDVAVILRHERIHGPAARWQPWRWVLDSVVPDAVGIDAAAHPVAPAAGEGDDTRRWRHGGLRVELFRDEGEGYHLNLTSGAPCFFVMWRLEEAATVAPEPIARPVVVSLSYNEAGRWLDAQETVEQVPAPPEVIEWMRAFAAEHYVVEPRRRKRPESFRPLVDRFGNAASVSTGKPDGKPGGKGGAGDG